MYETEHGIGFTSVAEGEVSYEDLKSKSESGVFREWEYECDPYVDRETGYEEYYDELNEVGWQGFQKMPTDEQDDVVKNVFSIYRSKNHLPITYLSESGIEYEVKKCFNYKPEFKGDTIRAGAGIGTSLCNFLFPNLQDAFSNKDADKGSARSTIGKFESDEWLEKAIRFCYNHGKSTPTPSSLMAALRQVGSSPTNFRPMSAKAIYERFSPENGVVWDMSTGFGGRLLGALSSNKNLTYIGTDPNTESMWNTHRLAEYIDMYTPVPEGVMGRYELHCVGSEVIDMPAESIDFAFSSPPYFDLEIYSDEPTQSTKKYPEIDGWLEGFARGTIRNVVKALKPGCLYGVNIADFNSSGGTKKVNYVDAWSEISAQEGAPHFGTVYLGVNARAGSIEQKMGVEKKENILLFQKV